MMRCGIGYDLHRLEPGRTLFLGGIEIPHTAGLAGHSDGDALIHALIDALLGAMGEGDIGQLFPDLDPRFKGIRSTELLRDVCARLKKKKLVILHASACLRTGWASRPRRTKAWASSAEAGPSPAGRRSSSGLNEFGGSASRSPVTRLRAWNRSS
jgi:2C-methyl-D-erythritol 2,4-cyclodiphosphate synthase